MTPNCNEHRDCDLVCSVCGDYYCHDEAHRSQPWKHVRRPDMPDDPEDYYNDRTEERWGIGAYDREAGRSRP